MKENTFRLGGEEFVLLFECFQSIATCQMESVLKHINSSPFVLDSSVQKITFSAGLSILGNDLTASLKQADELLYQAKSAGRNKSFPIPPLIASRHNILCSQFQTYFNALFLNPLPNLLSIVANDLPSFCSYIVIVFIVQCLINDYN